LASRKPIDQITVQDIVAFPIWEFAMNEEHLEGRDETWIRPVRAVAVPHNAYSLSVAADFTTRTGKIFPGIIGVTTAEELEFGHGALLVEGNYLFVPTSQFFLAPHARAELATALGETENDVFPLRFTLRVCLEGENAPRTGSFE
jgi:hypothetical protein